MKKFAFFSLLSIGLIFHSCKKEDDNLQCASSEKLLIKENSEKTYSITNGTAYNLTSFPFGYLAGFNSDSSATAQLMFGGYPTENSKYKIIDHKSVDMWLLDYVHIIIGIKEYNKITYFSGTSSGEVEFTITDNGLSAKWCDVEFTESDEAGYLEDNPRTFRSSGNISEGKYQAEQE